LPLKARPLVHAKIDAIGFVDVGIHGNKVTHGNEFLYTEEFLEVINDSLKETHVN
jgi:hypothetical protein